MPCFIVSVLLLQMDGGDVQAPGIQTGRKQPGSGRDHCGDGVLTEQRRRQTQDQPTQKENSKLLTLQKQSPVTGNVNVA